MDEIFQKTTSIFDVVKVAAEMPRRFGKNGELLIDYEQTETAERRRSSITAAGAKNASGRVEHAENGRTGGYPNDVRNEKIS